MKELYRPGITGMSQYDIEMHGDKISGGYSFGSFLADSGAVAAIGSAFVALCAIYGRGGRATLLGRACNGFTRYTIRAFYSAMYYSYAAGTLGRRFALQAINDIDAGYQPDAIVQRMSDPNGPYPQDVLPR